MVWRFVAETFSFVWRGWDFLLCKMRRSSLGKCGKKVRFFPLTSSFSYKHIFLGDDVYIGPYAIFSASPGAEIYIGSKVMFGPRVTIMTGDHNISQVGKYMFDVKEKLPENDSPVRFEGDNWIGAGAIILKRSYGWSRSGCRRRCGSGKRCAALCHCWWCAGAVD